MKENNAAYSPHLKVNDSRTGKAYTLAITDGTVKAVDIKKILDKDGAILRVYDPGYMNTACCTSRISYIDGDKGILNYRGFPIEDLAGKMKFSEVAFLLVYGEFPTAEQHRNFVSSITSNMHGPVENLQVFLSSFRYDAHPMAVLNSAMSFLGTFFPHSNPAIAGQDVYQSKVVRNGALTEVIGSIFLMAANILRHSEGMGFVLPRSDLGLVENFLYMIDMKVSAFTPHPKLVKAFETLFILHAEHELNCSTSAVRHLSSSNADVWTSIAGGVGALYGPRHGGANEAVLRMLEKIGSVENIPRYLESVKARKEKLMGFGHRVYKTYDPRAKIVRGIAEDVFSVVGKPPLIHLAMELEKAALADDFFVKRHLYPNIDFYSGIIYKALGFPTSFFPVLFAIPRVAGWLAHWYEFQDDPENRIVRPFQVYKGPSKRLVESTASRTVKAKVDSDSLKITQDALARRRSAGMSKVLSKL